MSAPSVHRWTASDGIELAWHETGDGDPVILLHGLFSDAQMNWIKFGHAERIAAEGYRVIMPDLRAHGLSGKPHEAAHYPNGILSRDLAELIAHLDVESFALGGFSLGARTTIQAVGEDVKPRLAVIAGMGLSGLDRWARRKDFFLEAIAKFDTSSRGDPHWLAIQFMRTMKVDCAAAVHLLNTFEDGQSEWLDRFTMPTLVVIGDEDRDNGSGEELAAKLADATFREVPGTHMSSVTKPEFGEAIATFLADAR